MYHQLVSVGLTLFVRLLLYHFFVAVDFSELPRSLSSENMATTASLPAYLLPGVVVHQPPHLEGDASLATEILPGPPTPAALQQSALKRDPRKPSMAYSYLPPSDPGSTYSGLTHGTLIGQDLEGPRSKRPRIDKGCAFFSPSCYATVLMLSFAPYVSSLFPYFRTPYFISVRATGRAQRASARNQGSNTAAPALDSSSHTASGPNSASQPIHIDSDSPTAVMDKEPSLSRSTSINLLESQTSNNNGKPKRKDKGKAKEVDSPPLRVKEEPKAFSLLTPEPPSNLVSNYFPVSCRALFLTLHISLITKIIALRVAHTAH